MPLRALISSLLIATALPGAAGAAPNATSRTVGIDPTKSHGTWEGWGVSLCWWAKILGDREDIADLLFTTKTVDFEGSKQPGLGLNILRYNAGACSWNEVDGQKMVVSNTILPFRQMEGYWLNPKSTDPGSDSWDWSVDANQRRMMIMAKERGADYFELFSNSPMWWMCENHNPSGQADGRKENLPPKNYDQFAIYLATIAAYAKEHWGITFTSVEPFNEPISGYWKENGKQEGSYFSPKAQQDFLPVLRRELDKRGLKDMPITASDETNYDQALKSWNAYGDATKRLVTKVNTHSYGGTKGPRAKLHEEVVEKDGKVLWNSEHGDKEGDGLHMVRCLVKDLKELHPTAWCYWQPFDGGNDGGWGFFDADLIKGTVGEANPKFYAFAQYSRHIRPGMTLIESGDPGTIAAYDPEQKKLVLVTFNEGPACEYTYDLSSLASARHPVPRWLTEPKGKTRYEPRDPLMFDGKTLVSELPADSIQTLEIEGVTLK